MKKQVTTTTRLEKGEAYWFVQPSTMECHRTRDERFESDDEKFVGGNYYPEKGPAEALAAALQEEFSERLEKIASEKDQLKLHLCSYLAENMVPLPARPKEITEEYVTEIEHTYTHVYSAVREYKRIWASLYDEEAAIRKTIMERIYYKQQPTTTN